MSLLKMLNPGYWYMKAAVLGVRVVFVAVALAVVAWVAVSTGVIDVGGIAGGLFRSLFGV
ncbi:hypothetical protein [Halorhabdus tiamatea]|nr:hypothetical protein [Halorhabdus tiamatea]